MNLMRARKPADCPGWVPDSDAHECMRDECGRAFSVLVRRHHCRKCGRVYCGTCAPLREELGRRFCVDCWTEHLLAPFLKWAQWDRSGREALKVLSVLWTPHFGDDAAAVAGRVAQEQLCRRWVSGDGRQCVGGEIRSMRSQELDDAVAPLGSAEDIPERDQEEWGYALVSASCELADLRYKTVPSLVPEQHFWARFFRIAKALLLAAK
eukprot:TRINITY_DN22758_c0_g1_i1.p1 TRINITY_DN22758_c0_g1~~TRINITY_DN22758_c0_g1_i1.p1  ORF type:complete len:209 (+),score=39.51 TRINITY_DN22758_c0_g1_i1:55-681(+)